MSLTPEERRKIYEEEKVRLEAQQSLRFTSLEGIGKSFQSLGCLILVSLVAGVAICGKSANTVSSPLETTSETPYIGSNPASAPVKNTPLLRLVSQKGTYENDYIYVEGQVENISSEPLKNVEAVVTLVDSNGQFVTSDEAIVAYNPLLPGQVSPFKNVIQRNPAIKTFKVEFKELMGGKLEHTTSAEKESSSAKGHKRLPEYVPRNAEERAIAKAVKLHLGKYAKGHKILDITITEDWAYGGQIDRAEQTDGEAFVCHKENGEWEFKAGGSDIERDLEYAGVHVPKRILGQWFKDGE